MDEPEVGAGIDPRAARAVRRDIAAGHLAPLTELQALEHSASAFVVSCDTGAQVVRRLMS